MNSGKSQPRYAAIFLITEAFAQRLSGAWGRHPLLGRMYLPAYRAGTEKVAQLRRDYPAEWVLPVLYGCHGAVDIQTVDLILSGQNGKRPA